MFQLIDHNVAPGVHQQIISKVTPKAQRRISQTAKTITDDIENTRSHLGKFLSRYVRKESVLYASLMRDMMMSIQITWRQFQKFSDAEREFEQYLQRVLTGCWHAVRHKPVG